MSESTLAAKVQELEGLMRQNLHSMVREVRVLVREGQVVVQGIAASYYAKQLAQHLVLLTLGKQSFVNELEVRRAEPAGSAE
jgi:hypothetical protein